MYTVPVNQSAGPDAVSTGFLVICMSFSVGWVGSVRSGGALDGGTGRPRRRSAPEAVTSVDASVRARRSPPVRGRGERRGDERAGLGGVDVVVDLDQVGRV